MLDAAPVFIPVISTLQDFISHAIERLSYLYPHVQFAACSDGIEVRGELTDDIRRDIHYVLHRAKIAAQARPLREMLHRSALV